jgi:hypothetical protein
MTAEDRNRAIAAEIVSLGESFLPGDDRPEVLDRRKKLADLREQIEQLADGTISDDTIIEALWGMCQLAAAAALGLGEIASDSLALAEEMLAEQPVDEARGFRADQIRVEVQRLRAALDRAPTRAETAQALNTSEATLKRAVRDLGLGSWPPAPPPAQED